MPEAFDGYGGYLRRPARIAKRSSSCAIPTNIRLNLALNMRIGFAPMQVSVRDYHLSHAAADGRALPIETFHAKLVVADDTLAYVGSANLLSSSEGLSLETGLLVEGGPQPKWLG